jgi:hypothetical protein
MFRRLMVALLTLAMWSGVGVAQELEVSKKWFPGHYLYVNDRAYTPGMDDSRRSLVKNEAAFTGYHMRISWSTLEPQKGVYDFSSIESDLAKAVADGKKYILHPHDRVFGGQTRPSLPGYLLTDPEYDGGEFTSPDGNRYPKLWNRALAARMVLLVEALGAAFDAHPALAYVALEETALGNARDQPGYNNVNHAQYFLDVHDAFARAFPTTIFSQYVNYNGGMTTAQREMIMKNLVETHGHGFGGPDVWSKQPAHENQWGYFYVNYKGVATITGSAQQPTYTKGLSTPLEVLNYAVDFLGANFMSWAPVPPSTTVNPNFTINDVIAMLRAQNGRINTAPPTNLLRPVTAPPAMQNLRATTR